MSADARAGGDGGAILVVGCLVFTGLIAFTALVIDVGNAYQHRRQAQNAADAAALAAAQELPDAPAAVTTAKDFALANYGIAYDAWVGCKDEEALAVLPDAGNSNTCISLDPGMSDIRVKLPATTVATYFAGLIGIDSLDVGATATARAILRIDDRIIPAAVTATMGTGNLCIENSGADVDCALRSSGNFGSLDSPRLNIYVPSANEQSNGLAINYAMGLDHPIDLYSAFPAVCDGELRVPCNTTNEGTTLTADHLNVATGNVVPPVTEGFVTGFTVPTDDHGDVDFCGRLARPDLTKENLIDPMPGGNCTPGGPTVTVLGTTINVRHVYFWLNDDARLAFYPEAAGTIVADWYVGNPVFDPGDLRLECFLEGYRYDYATGVETVPDCSAVGLTWPLAGDPTAWPIFRIGMATDPRFGMIPVLAEWPSGGSTAEPLVAFWGEYAYRLYLSSTKLKGVDAWVYEPALVETEAGVPGLQFGFQADPVLVLVD